MEAWLKEEKKKYWKHFGEKILEAHETDNTKILDKNKEIELNSPTDY